MQANEVNKSQDGLKSPSIIDQDSLSELYRRFKKVVGQSFLELSQPQRSALIGLMSSNGRHSFMSDYAKEPGKTMEVYNEILNRSFGDTFRPFRENIMGSFCLTASVNELIVDAFVNAMVVSNSNSDLIQDSYPATWDAYRKVVDANPEGIFFFLMERLQAKDFKRIAYRNV